MPRSSNKIQTIDVTFPNMEKYSFDVEKIKTTFKNKVFMSDDSMSEQEFLDSKISFSISFLGEIYTVTGLPKLQPPLTSEESPFNNFTFAPGEVDPNDPIFKMPIGDLFKWFTLDEKLPPIDKWFLIKTDSGNHTVMLDDKKMCLYDTNGNLFDANNNCFGSNDVIKWKYIMKLP